MLIYEQIILTQVNKQKLDNGESSMNMQSSLKFKLNRPGLKLGSYFLASSIFFFASQGLGFDHSHSRWDSILKKYVVKQGASTKVKYLELQKDRTGLEAYLKEVQAVKLTEYKAWTESQKLAFLFNSYNALTVDLILKNTSPQKPLQSIKDIGNLIRNTWKIKFFTFLGESSHLDHIEQEIARPQFDEPRMHFAFNCAAIGCPNLIDQAFVSERLNQQLDQATKDFLSDTSRNRLSKDGKTIELSQIFNWYGEDFEKSKKFKSLNNFLATYMALPEKTAIQVRSGDIKLKYLDYDWSLNKAK